MAVSFKSIFVVNWDEWFCIKRQMLLHRKDSFWRVKSTTQKKKLHREIKNSMKIFLGEKWKL